MAYRCVLCGVEVIGRLVWIALGVTKAEERCPHCDKWAQFVPTVTRIERRAA